MNVFFRRLWSFARPYRTRLVLGLVCGMLYALTNGALVVMIKVVVDLIFSGTAHVSVAQELEKAPGFLRSLIGWVSERQPRSGAVREEQRRASDAAVAQRGPARREIVPAGPATSRSSGTGAPIVFTRTQR